MNRVTEADLKPVRKDVLAAFVNTYAWIPQWEAEVTSAVEGVEGQILDAEQYGGGEAARSELSRIHRYRKDAYDDSRMLARALRGSNDFQPVSVKDLKDDELVRKGLAKHLLFTQALKRDKWPMHVEPYFARSLKPFIGMVEDKQPAELLGLWYEAYPSSTERHNHWLLQAYGALLNPTIRNAIRSRRVQAVPQ